jgi:hypothetical protein
VSEKVSGIPEDSLLKISNFMCVELFAINALPTSNFLEDNHRTYSNFYKCRTSSTELECLKRNTT